MLPTPEQLEILTEGRIRITPEENRQINRLVTAVLDDIRGRPLTFETMVKVGLLKFEYADSTPENPNTGEIMVYVANSSTKEFGRYTVSKTDPSNKKILLQQIPFRNYFTRHNVSLNDALNFIRTIIIHELIHAKDPNINAYFNPKKHNDPTYYMDSSKYYSKRHEAAAFSGEFYELINSAIDAILQYPTIENIEFGNRLLDDILDTVQQGKESFSPETIRFMDRTFLVNYDSIKHMRKFARPRYKEFMKTLYKHIDDLREKLNKEQTNEIFSTLTLSNIILHNLR